MSFPNHDEQRKAIAENFKGSRFYIKFFAREFAPATVVVDGETYDVSIYRDRSGSVKVSDVFNTKYDTGE